MMLEFEPDSRTIFCLWRGDEHPNGHLVSIGFNTSYNLNTLGILS
jgi:hypothetical protein